MHSERQRNGDQCTDPQATDPSTGSSAWADLEVTVPNDRDQTSIVTLVECVLVELTHETVGAEYRSEHVWGTQRTQYVAADGLGATFQKRHFDARLGWHETTISRAAVREELLTRLTRPSSLASERTHESVSDRSDRCYVTHVDELRRNEEY